jgi:hypothetical protein
LFTRSRLSLQFPFDPIKAIQTVTADPIEAFKPVKDLSRLDPKQQDAHCKGQRDDNSPGEKYPPIDIAESLDLHGLPE